MKNAAVRWLAPLLLVAACSSSLDDMEENRKLWAQRGPSSYQYTYEQVGFLPEAKLQIVVRSGAVESTTVLSGAAQEGQTIDQLFDDVKGRLESDCDVRAGYDPALGYPLSVYSDCGEEGDGWNVTGFTQLP